MQRVKHILGARGVRILGRDLVKRATVYPH